MSLERVKQLADKLWPDIKNEQWKENAIQLILDEINIAIEGENERLALLFDVQEGVSYFGEEVAKIIRGEA